MNKKSLFHPRNRHQGRYDFKKLKASLPALIKFIKKNPQNDEDTIDFANPEAVKSLNRALLKSYYELQYWDIPKGYLCPPIPGRADYIHFLSDLLPEKKENIHVLDIGTGANCIYPLIGVHEYDWNFVGAEIDQEAFLSAKKNVEENKLSAKIEIRIQGNRNHFFKGIIQSDEYFDFTLCNPPFHASKKDADFAMTKKSKNLGIKSRLNFGGKANELWCNGGEAEFLRKMILESAEFKSQVTWFTSLVSKKENLSGVYGELKRQNAKVVKTIEMGQGQKISRFVAWKF